MDSSSVERSILGSVLLANSLWEQTKGLREQDFSLSAHRCIFRRMRDLAESGLPIDMVTLAEELGRHNEIESIRGVEYLSSLIDGVPERTSIAHYVRILQENAARRRATKLGEQVQKLAADPSASTSAFGELGSTLSELTPGEESAPSAILRRSSCSALLAPV